MSVNVALLFCHTHTHILGTGLSILLTDLLHHVQPLHVRERSITILPHTHTHTLGTGLSILLTDLLHHIQPLHVSERSITILPHTHTHIGNGSIYLTMEASYGGYLQRLTMEVSYGG